MTTTRTKKPATNTRPPGKTTSSKLYIPCSQRDIVIQLDEDSLEESIDPGAGDPDRTLRSIRLDEREHDQQDDHDEEEDSQAEQAEQDSPASQAEQPAEQAEQPAEQAEQPAEQACSTA
ncbi:hypothetical protein BGZ65_012967, partial [Modicella reniformis]